MTPVLRRVAALMIGAVLLFGSPSTGFAEPPSSAVDRARFVAIARRLEAAPLADDIRDDREWALTWLTRAPDVSVSLCLDTVGGLDRAYPYSGQVLFAYMFSMAAFVIEHPEASDDAVAQQMAGLNGALNAYQAILTTKSAPSSPGLDALVAARTQGTLPAFVAKATAKCEATGK